MKNSRSLFAGMALAISYFVVSTTLALAQQASISVSIKDHRFQPSEIRVPANTPITLMVRNLDSTPEEFESKTLRVEKVVAGSSSTTLHIRPLGAGRYRFFGDYHEETAEGFLVVE
jgi:hypothetical protein